MNEKSSKQIGRKVAASGAGGPLRIYRGVGEDAGKIEAFLMRLEPDERREILRSLHLEIDDLGRELAVQVADSSGYSLFVEDGGDVVGFASFRLMSGLKDTAWIGVAVAENHRRGGLAVRLLVEISRMAARYGVQRMVGFSDAGVDVVRALLRSAGLDADIRSSEEGSRFLISPVVAMDSLEEASSASIRRRDGGGGLRALFEPGSVAVIGASRDPESLGHRIVVNLVSGGFEGPVFPVNPHAEHIRSIRAAASIRELDGKVDLAVLVLPAEDIPRVVDECAEAGVKALIVISAYYSEVGETGREREARLAAQIRRHGMRMLGPNCTGLINTCSDIRLNASFCSKMPTAGGAALCSQSGALGMAITAMAERLDLGLAAMVNVGNRADITVNDLLEYWEGDEGTRVILFYLESFGDPRRFARVARRVGRSRPIVVVKGGRSRAGRRVEARSVPQFDASNVAIEALMRQTGIIRADNLGEMFDIGRALMSQPLPAGGRVAVMTNAGGAGILAVDALENADLDVVMFSEKTRAALKEILPPEAGCRNPVDMLAACPPETYEAVISLLLDTEETDALVVLYTPLGMADTEQIAQAIFRGVSSSKDRRSLGRTKPVLVSIVGEDSRRSLSGGPQEENLPVYTFPEMSGRVLGKILHYARWRSGETGIFPEFSGRRLAEVRACCTAILRKSGPGWVPHDDLLELLDLAALPRPAGRVVRTLKDVQDAASFMSFPLALRLHSARMEYRLEEGGIRLDLRNLKEVREAFSGMKRDFGRQLARGGDGVLVLQEMVGEATEIRLSSRDDRRFGPLVSIGMGGVHLEALQDRVFRVSPLTDLDAAAMIRELRGRALLEGYRGHPAADVDALKDLLLRLSSFVEALPEISAIDLDPVMVLRPGKGCVLLDARLRLQE